MRDRRVHRLLQVDEKKADTRPPEGSPGLPEVGAGWAFGCLAVGNSFRRRDGRGALRATASPPGLPIGLEAREGRALGIGEVPVGAVVDLAAGPAEEIHGILLEEAAEPCFGSVDTRGRGFSAEN